MRRYALVLPLVALAAAAACGGGDEDAAPEPSPTSAVTSVPTSGSVPTTGATATTAKATGTTGKRPPVNEPAEGSMANGTHSVYLTGVDPKGRTISVDVVQVLDPRSAEAASVCPEIARGEHDGYCVQNANGQLRTVPVAPKASLQVLDGSTLRSVDMSGLAAARQGQKEDNFFQVTISGGRVTSAKELFRA